MSQKQERELCAEVRICSSSAILAVVQVVSSWSNIPCLPMGKASAPKEIPFSQIANIISKGEKKTWEKYIFLHFLLKWQKEKNTREGKYENTRKSSIRLSSYTSLLLLLSKNSVISSYWIFSAHVKNKINLGDVITFLALKLLWKSNKLLLWI